jgi:hypothetical protein
MVNKEIYTIENINENEFEKQFGNVAKIDDLIIRHVKPKVIENITKILIAPGWARGSDSTKEGIEYLFNKGREVISLDHTRLGGEKISGNKEYPDVESIKANSLLTAIKRVEASEDREKVDVVAHSEGCINLVIAALENPELFRNIVLVSPAGMIGDDSFMELIKRFNEEKNREKKIDGDNYKSNRTFLKYAAKNLLRSIKEVNVIASVQIQDYLKILKSQGIGISIISGVDDLAFPMDKMQKIANTEILDGFYSVKGGHNTLYNEPGKYMPIAEQALEALEKRGHNINK